MKTQSHRFNRCGQTVARGLAQAMGLMFLALITTSCQPYSNSDGGDITVSFDGNDTILLDTSAQSCRARVALATADDLSALHMNLGRMRVVWTPPTATTTLKIVYIKLNIVSGGLGEAEFVETIASQELNCLIRGDPSGDPTLTNAQANLRFPQDIIVGGLQPSDTTKRSNFSGAINVLVYGIMQDGATQTPVVGRTSMRFQFSGIF